VLAFTLLLAACAPPEVERLTPTPTATFVPVEITPVLDLPVVTTPEPSPADAIERIALATRIQPDGTPIDERTVVPELPEMIYLCVLVREVENVSRFRAYWFQDNQVIAQSDTTVTGRPAGPGWVTLRYRPIARLDPAAQYEVELRVDDTPIERFLFRVGIGAAEDAVAEAAFASDFDIVGKPIDARTLFHIDEPTLTFKVRISNQVDPTGMRFTTLWYRGDAQIARVNPDPHPADSPDPPNPRRLDFTFAPSTRLAPGDYRVLLLLNGNVVRSVPFTVTAEPIEAEPEPTATPAA
jgi:hypothetical protein